MDDVVREIKKRYWKEISKKANVNSFSGKLRPRERNNKTIPNTRVFRVYVEKKEPLDKLRTKDIIPERLSLGSDEIEVDVVPIGRIRYMDEPEEGGTKPEDHQKRHRPILAGVSCTHFQSPACTLNWFFKRKVRDSSTGPIYQILIAGNNHCFGRENDARVDDPILQPSPNDKGDYAKDQVGSFLFNVETKFASFKCPARNSLYKVYRGLYHLAHLRPLEPVNKVDIAFAIPNDNIEIEYRILGIDGRVIKTSREHHENTFVYKSGRTSGVTSFTIIDNTWNGYVEGRRGKAYYEDCVLCYGVCKGGDSGSPVVSKVSVGGTPALMYHGALFAGSQTHMVYCKVENIEKEAGVRAITY